MRYLRIKCNEKIRQKTQRLNTKYDNITQMRENYINIKQFLRFSHQLSNQSSQFQNQSFDDRNKNQASSRGRNNSFDAIDNARRLNTQIVQANLSVRIQKDNNNNQRNRKDRRNDNNQVIETFDKIKCYSCDEEKHKSNDSTCSKYAEYQKKRNRHEEKTRKARA